MVRNINEKTKIEAGERIKYIRENIMKMKSSEFAELIGTTRQNLNGIENGNNGFGVDMLMEICEKTNTSADFILYGKNNILSTGIQDIAVGLKKENIAEAFQILKKLALLIEKENEIDKIKEC